MAREKLTFSDEQMAALREVVYGGYKTKPQQKILERGGWRGKMSEGGGIDYNYYSGKKNKYDFYTRGYSPTVDAEEGSTSANFKKISDYLGIKDLGSTKDLQQIYDYVLGYKKPEAEKKEEVVEEAPAEETSGVTEEAVEELPDAEVTEEEVEKLVPTTPYMIGQQPTTIRNPAKKKVKGGISQFSSSGGNRTLPTIKSKLLNI